MEDLDKIKIGLEILAIIVSVLAAFGVWKWLPRWVKKLYNHYKANREQKWIGLLEVQRLQNVNIGEISKKVDDLIYQFCPNGGNNALGKIEQILDNQVLLKEVQDAGLYLDTTPIVKTNMKGECTFANLAYLRLFGFSSFEEAAGLGGYRSVHPDDRERIKKEYMENITAGNLFVSNYRKINIITGKVFNIASMTKIIRDSKGEAIEAIGVLQILPDEKSVSH